MARTLEVVATNTGALAQLKAARHQFPFGVAVLVIVLDIVFRGSLINSTLPAVVAAVAVWVAVGLAARQLFAAAILAAAASTAVSLALDLTNRYTSIAILGRESWVTAIELVGLGLLAAWSVRSLPRNEAVVVIAAIFVALMALVAYRDARSSYDSFVRTGLLLGLGGCVGGGVLLRDIDQERINETELARHDERISIARELHDVVAHHVTGIVVQAQAAQLVADSRPDAAAAALSSIERAGSEALAAMRRMVGALRDDNADAPISPTATIRDLQDLAARTTALGLPVRLMLDEPVRLPTELVVSIHRIVREALTNAQRHAVGATVVDVSVVRNGANLDVIIRDDGRQARAERRGGAGFGLVGMAERVNALGGLFVAGPVASGGWQVHAQFPLAQFPVAQFPVAPDRVAT